MDRTGLKLHGCNHAPVAEFLECHLQADNNPNELEYLNHLVRLAAPDLGNGLEFGMSRANISV